MKWHLFPSAPLLLAPDVANLSLSWHDGNGGVRGVEANPWVIKSSARSGLSGNLHFGPYYSHHHFNNKDQEFVPIVQILRLRGGDELNGADENSEGQKDSKRSKRRRVRRKKESSESKASGHSNEAGDNKTDVDTPTPTSSAASIAENDSQEDKFPSTFGGNENETSDQTKRGGKRVKRRRRGLGLNHIFGNGRNDRKNDDAAKNSDVGNTTPERTMIAEAGDESNADSRQRSSELPEIHTPQLDSIGDDSVSSHVSEGHQKNRKKKRKRRVKGPNDDASITGDGVVSFDKNDSEDDVEIDLQLDSATIVEDETSLLESDVPQKSKKKKRKRRVKSTIGVTSVGDEYSPSQTAAELLEETQIDSVVISADDSTLDLDDAHPNNEVRLTSTDDEPDDISTKLLADEEEALKLETPYVENLPSEDNIEPSRKRKGRRRRRRQSSHLNAVEEKAEEHDDADVISEASVQDVLETPKERVTLGDDHIQIPEPVSSESVVENQRNEVENNSSTEADAPVEVDDVLSVVPDEDIAIESTDKANEIEGNLHNHAIGEVAGQDVSVLDVDAVGQALHVQSDAEQAEQTLEVVDGKDAEDLDLIEVVAKVSPTISDELLEKEVDGIEGMEYSGDTSASLGDGMFERSTSISSSSEMLNDIDAGVSESWKILTETMESTVIEGNALEKDQAIDENVVKTELDSKNETSDSVGKEQNLDDDFSKSIDKTVTNNFDGNDGIEQKSPLVISENADDEEATTAIDSESKIESTDEVISVSSVEDHIKRTYSGIGDDDECQSEESVVSDATGFESTVFDEQAKILESGAGEIDYLNSNQTKDASLEGGVYTDLDNELKVTSADGSISAPVHTDHDIILEKKESTSNDDSVNDSLEIDDGAADVISVNNETSLGPEPVVEAELEMVVEKEQVLDKDDSLSKPSESGGDSSEITSANITFVAANESAHVQDASEVIVESLTDKNRKILSTMDDDCLTVSVVTWNLGEAAPSEEEALFLRKFRRNSSSTRQSSLGSDLVMIGAQECEDIKPRRSEGHRSRHFRRIGIQMLGREYVPLAIHSLGGIQMGFYCHRSVLGDIELINIADVTCGVGNVFHNKGAIGLYLKIKRQCDSGVTKSCKMLFVTAHLAAHVKNMEARNDDFRRIVSELEAQAPARFLRPKKNRDGTAVVGDGSYLLSSMDHVFFSGDLNYRIDLPREYVESCIVDIVKETQSKSNDIELTANNSNAEVAFLMKKLLRRDQLLQTIAAGRAFSQFNEGKISFLPTFKFDKGSPLYDTSHKQRVPAWTDRILFKSKQIRVLSYDSVPEAMHSDHRPVYGTFRLGWPRREMTDKRRTNKTKRTRSRSRTKI